MVKCLLLVIALSPMAMAQVKNEVAVSGDSLVCLKNPAQLKSNQKLPRTLGGGECHSYEIILSANDFLQVAVEQKGIDVVVTTYSQERSQLTRVDRPNGSRGPETISLIAPVDGSYFLSVESLEAVSARGDYDLTVLPLRTTANDDAKQMKAEWLISEGELLRAKAKSLRASIPKFLEAAELWHSLGNTYEEALAWYAAGYSCTSLGDNQTAIEYFKRALPMFVQLNSTSGAAMVHARLGFAYLYLADLDSAFESFTKSLELNQDEKNLRREGIALFGLGWIYALRAENEKALQKFSESLECRRRAMDRSGEALTLTGIGKLESRFGRHPEALKNLTLALELLPKKERYAEADILSNLGWIYRALHQTEQALTFFNRALTIRAEVGDSIGEATTRYGISMVHRSEGRLKEAETEIVEALKIVESLRAKGSNLQLRLSYFASVQDYYAFYISLLTELDQKQPSGGYAAKALEASERARARGLLDLLAEAKIDLLQDVDPVLLSREREYSEKLNALALQRSRIAGDQNGVETSEKEINRLHDELEVVRAQIRTLNPRYAVLTELQPLTALEIQKQILDEDTLLLQYVLSESRSFVLAVTSDKITTHPLASRAQIESVARQFYEALTLRNRLDAHQSAPELRAKISGTDSAADDLARDLSGMLLSPVKQRLTKQRVIVVASGALQFVPFAALTKPSQVFPLVEEHEVIVLPSLTALSVIRQDVKTRTPPPKEIVVLGDPVFDRSDSRIKEAIDEVITTRPEFPRLIGSRWESEQILAGVSPGEGSLVLDFAANRSFALSGEVGKYRLVHFATHALIDVEHPALSGIVLSLVDNNGNPQDGFLSLNDIFKLKLPADLVVLSGCRTALGTDYAGEGLVGLTRAFMYAGASRVAVSLWQVADKPTSELMVRFYKHLLGPEKLAPAAALRKAQLDLRKDPRWRAPYFWAGFILQGDWR